MILASVVATATFIESVAHTMAVCRERSTLSGKSRRSTVVRSRKAAMALANGQLPSSDGAFGVQQTIFNPRRRALRVFVDAVSVLAALQTIKCTHKGQAAPSTCNSVIAPSVAHTWPSYAHHATTVSAHDTPYSHHLRFVSHTAVRSAPRLW